MDKLSTKWYVVRAISGKEKKAKEYIESEMAKRGWTEEVPQVLVPTEPVVSVRNGKKVIKERNSFPGYILIEAALRDEIIPVIQNLPNVLDFLRDVGGKPIPMRQVEINRILGNMDEQLDSDGGMVDKFIVGEPVKVIDGPFNSFSGIVEEVNEEKMKLKVTVKIFGRKTPLELNYNQVEKE
jgi:transcriptional antiterminator NusG